jgi:hypothetical protein
VELEVQNYRAAMVRQMYQAQVKCVKCNSWVLTKNLEAFKDEAGELVAEATDVTCTNSGCGEVLGTVQLKGWQYTAPITWRRRD